MTCLGCCGATTGQALRCERCRLERKREGNARYRDANPDKVKAGIARWARTPRGRQLMQAGKKRWIEANFDKYRAYRNALGRRKWAARRGGLIVPTSPAISFPYIHTARPEHADYLAINALVPWSIPGREDVVQELALAIFEGRAILDRETVRAFISGHYRKSFEASGYAISLSEPRRDGRLWDDVLASHSPAALSTA